MKKVLLICAHRSGRSPSQRYRFEQYLQFLEKNGFSFTYSNLLNERDDSIFYTQGHLLQKVQIMLQSIIQRIKDLRSIKNFDLVFIQRESLFLGTTFFERGVKRAGIPLIFDFDDSIWLADTSPGNKKWEWLKQPEKLFRTTALADLVIAGNRYLAEKVRDHAQKVVVIPTTIDTKVHIPIEDLRKKEIINIGWSGSLSTIKHFNLLVPVLIRIQQKYREKIRFTILADKTYTHPDLPVQSLIWSPESEVALLNTFDIGIMPLPDDEWSRGKCGLKGLSYMACGIPAVMSSVGVNPEIITDKINGRLAADEEDWYNILSELIENSALQKSLGEAGRKHVQEFYSVEALKDRYLNLFRELTDS